MNWCEKVPNFNWSGDYCRLELLERRHLDDLEERFDPTLFNYYPKPYKTALEFVGENLEMIKGGNYVPFAIIDNESKKAIGCSEYSSIDLKNRKLEIAARGLNENFTDQLLILRPSC